MCSRTCKKCLSWAACLVLVGMAVASMVPAHAQTVLVNDTFDIPSGTATRIDDAADPLDVAWWETTGINNPAHANDNGTPGIGTDNTMVLDANPVMVANFSDYTLGSIGDWIELSFDMRWLPATPADAGFRFGLYNSNGTVVGADGFTIATDDDTGYWTLIESNDPGFIATKDGGFLTGPNGLSSTVLSAASNLPHNLAMRLTKENATQMRMAISYDGVEVISSLDTNINTATFNEIAVRNTRGSGADLFLDNVQVINSVLNADFTWNAGAGGDWDTTTNWTPNGKPGDGTSAFFTQETVLFAGSISADSTVFTDEQVTINNITFDNSTSSYGIAGQGVVNMITSSLGPTPTIDVDNGNHEFQVEVDLLNDTTVTAGDDTTMTFHNTIDIGANDLTIAPALGGLENGMVVLNTSISGTGNVSNTAALSTGLAASLGSGDFSSTGTLDFDITPNSAGMLTVGGTATLDGTISVDFLDGETPLGDVTLLTAGSPIVLPSGLPTLNLTGASGLSLALSGDSMSLLLTSGTSPTDPDGNGIVDGADFLIIQRTDPSLIPQWELDYGGPPSLAASSAEVAAVPEPASVMLLLGGFLIFPAWRR